MSTLIDYWDVETQSQKQREATSEEVAQLEKDRADAFKRASAQRNAEVKAQLDANDLRAIRALLEGDEARLSSIRFEQEQLRLQLVPE